MKSIGSNTYYALSFKAKWISLCCVLFLHLWTLPKAFAATQNTVKGNMPQFGYRVKMVVAPAFYRCMDNSDWLDLKSGQNLPLGCLLQVNEGGVAILIPPKLVKGRTPEDLQITTPVVLRLTRDILRQVSVSPRFLRSAKSAAKSFKPMGTLYQLEEAWKKLAISLEIPNSPEGVEFVQFNEVEKNISMMAQQANMEMYYPDNDSIHTKQEQPYQMKISWSDPKNRKNFDIYTWPAREQRGKAHARTSGNTYELPIYNTGSYFVQVVSEDKKWQTSPHLFHVKQEKLEQKLRIEDKPLPIALTIVFPRDNTVIYASSFADSDSFNANALKKDTNHNDKSSPTLLTSINFAWTVPEASTLRATRLTIESTDKRKLKSDINLSNRMTTVALPPGKYRWSLQFAALTAGPNSSEDTTYRSPQYALEIKLNAATSLTEVIADPKDLQRTIYFSNGF